MDCKCLLYSRFSVSPSSTRVHNFHCSLMEKLLRSKQKNSASYCTQLNASFATHGPPKMKAQKDSAPEFPYWFSPICMICPLAPCLSNFPITAAQFITNPRWLIIIHSPMIVYSFWHFRLVSRWRVGANDKILSDTYGSALSLGFFKIKFGFYLWFNSH